MIMCSGCNISLIHQAITCQLTRLNHMKVSIFTFTYHFNLQSRSLHMVPLAVSWNLEPKESSLSPGRMWIDNAVEVTIAFTGDDCPSCLWGNREWRQMCYTEMDESRPSVFFCLQTSFVICKTAVNIPLNGTASVQQIKFSLLKETTQVRSSNVAHYGH